MSHLATSLAVLGPVFLLACALLPKRREGWLRSLGLGLPWLSLAGSVLAAVAVWLGGEPLAIPGSLAESGPLADLALVYLDRLSATILLLISFLGVIVSRFSRNYMEGEPRLGQYYKWLSATLGSALFIVLSGNLVLFTLAWMATSLSLHKLLVFYRERPPARLAARKKFIISRVGDLCLIGAAVLIGFTFGTLDFPELFAAAEAAREGSLVLPIWNLHAIALLLAGGALLKSAQFPFHTWLPDTLETPTPVSALMHAGIINAGGYLIVRMSPLVVLSAPSLSVLAVIGAFTAVFAGLVMLTQTSVKKSLAFSTVAQMGFMMLQCGLGAFGLAALHIVAHSLYKAYAFLSSGNLPPVKERQSGLSLRLLLSSLFLGVFAFVTVASLVGKVDYSGPYIWVLGFVVSLGLAFFAQETLRARAGSSLPLFFKTLAMAVGLSGLYSLLHGASYAWLGDSIAKVPSDVDGWQMGIYAGLAVIFASGYLLPQLAMLYPKNDSLRRVYQHACHGFYCNTWINRILQGQKPSRVRPSAYSCEDDLKAKQALPAIERACQRIAPLWSLRNFVAVNPYLGYSATDFGTAAQELQRATGAQALPSLEDLKSRLLSEKGMDDSLLGEAWEAVGEEARHALEADGLQPTMTSIEQRMREPSSRAGLSGGIATVARLVDGGRDGYWQRMIAEDVSRRCAGYFDEAQASWPFPYKDLSLYQSWLASMPRDLNMDFGGLRGFAEAAGELPPEAEEMISLALTELRVPEKIAEGFLQAQLFSMRGWAGYCQSLRHEARLRGEDDTTIVDLLAIRLAYDLLLYRAKADRTLTAAWLASLKIASDSAASTMTAELALRLLLQEAIELSARRPLLEALHSTDSQASAGERATLQAVFCIDVRSEVYRRALEAQSPAIETFGFAGFFGLPIRYRSGESDGGTARCPVLLQPGIEANGCPGPKGNLQSLGHGWASFQKVSPSCFPFVELAGLGYSWKSLRASFPVLPEAVEEDGSPAPRSELGAEEKAEAAAGMLRHLGLTENFAAFVLFAGHGSHSMNNPHASSLDCGACGGHAGDVNARVAAALLNDPQTREGLAAKHGIRIPEDTRFLAGLHNTTTDELSLFAEHTADLTLERAGALTDVKRWLARAGKLARCLRAPLLGLGEGPRLEAEVKTRAHDWSQTRPEWGLVGNYAFVAAPRNRTRGLNLDGRVFLHNYDATKDEGNQTLTLILTAPVVVASWINLQYYGSSVDHDHFGSGSKVLHNIAGGIGVLSGNGGDLQTGLPMQSLASARGLEHDPLRLHVCIEASTEAIDSVLAAHKSARDLVENRWIHLFALDREGGPAQQRQPDGSWKRVSLGDALEASGDAEGLVWRAS